MTIRRVTTGHNAQGKANRPGMHTTDTIDFEWIVFGRSG